MLKRWMVAFAIVMGVSLASATPASAQQHFNFNYVLENGDVFSGVLNGALGGDNNTFTIANAVSYSINGAPLTIGGDVFGSYDGSIFGSNFNGSGGPGIITVDGSFADFIDYNTSSGVGWDFIVNYPGYNYSGGSNIGTFGFGDGSDNVFAANRWTVNLTAAGGAPEPAAWAMMILGFGIAGATLRRRQAKAAAPFAMS